MWIIAIGSLPLKIAFEVFGNNCVIRDTQGIRNKNRCNKYSKKIA